MRLPWGGPAPAPQAAHPCEAHSMHQSLYEARAFRFTAVLESHFADLRAELLQVGTQGFADSPDSLTTVEHGYDERGWKAVALFGPGDAGVLAHNRATFPRAAAACGLVPNLANASLSLFAPGTRLYPHCGELDGVLRCHLPLLVPSGDVGLRIDGQVVRWVEGQCVVFDDRFEHEAWNLGDGERVVLLVTFGV
jgi:ornithine lipid ester-linked acyl 2-hydroxylase